MQFFRKVPVLATPHGEIDLNKVVPVSIEYSNGAVLNASALNASALNASSRSAVLGAVAVGVLAGIVASAYWWKNRVREEILQATPLERVEDLIASCESKIEDIERSIDSLKKDR